MERIKQAVEQARKHRQQTAGMPVEPVQPVSRGQQAEGEHEARVTYTKTKEVTVSAAVRENNRLVASIPGHALQDTYRILRTRVLQEMRANNWRTIGVTSPDVGSGKTLTAINLAISIARDRSSTAMLFDADLRRPTPPSSSPMRPDPCAPTGLK